MGNIKLEKAKAEMGDSSTDNFQIGPPSQYAGGHAAIGVTLLIEAALPIILYYSWQKSRLDMLNGTNMWYKYSWETMTWGGLVTFAMSFLFWAISFAGKSTTSYLYFGMLLLFGGLYGFYITASTIIFQFQAIRGYTSHATLMKSEIWGTFGIYTVIQLIASFIGQHYLLDSVMYLLSAEIKEWCEDHPGVCEDYNVLDHN